MIFSKDFMWILRSLRRPLKTCLLLFSVGFSVLILLSCSSIKQVPQIVEHSIRDTLYMSNIQHDSIYLHDSSSVQYRFGTIDTTVISALGINLRVDTVYQDRMKYGYKYKLLRDTTYINRVDSIPIIKQVTVTQQVKYIPPWCKWLSAIGAIAILLLVLPLLRKLKIV